MASDTGGVPSFSIQGRLYRERERLSHGGMTEDEREFRKNWIRDQILCDNEPVDVPQIYKEQNNIFKRIMNAPLNALFHPFVKKFGPTNCNVVKSIIGKCLFGISFVYAATYYFKYNQNDWTRKGGWRVLPNRPICLPGETCINKVKYDPNHEISFIHDQVLIEEADDLLDLEPVAEEIQKVEEIQKIEEIEKIEGIKTIENETTEPIEIDFDVKDDFENIENKTDENIIQEVISDKSKMDVGDKGPKYRSLGSYYASRGFENSPI